MFTLNCKGRLLTIDKPVVMGILNATPDSFLKQSRTQTIEAALLKAKQMLDEGAVIIDVGGQSTRPGSNVVSGKEEADRVIPLIEAINSNYPQAFISVDTFYASVAENALKAGASIINDISGGSYDKEILDVAALFSTPYICMHIKGNTDNMHNPYTYENIALEVLDYFIQKNQQWKAHNVNDIIIDPGFGFSKNSVQNLELLSRLEMFTMLDKPILAGLSRKSTIYKTLNIAADDALNGTTVLNTIALMNGADILRVHDVKQAEEAITLMQAYKQQPAALP